MDEANRILDEMGLTVGSDGYRHYSDGDRIELIADAFNIYALYQQATVDWLMSDGVKGVEPYERAKGPLMELKKLSDQANARFGARISTKMENWWLKY